MGRAPGISGMPFILGMSVFVVRWYKRARRTREKIRVVRVKEGRVWVREWSLNDRDGIVNVCARENDVRR